MRCISRWNSLSEEIVTSDTELKFKTGLDQLLLSDRSKTQYTQHSLFMNVTSDKNFIEYQIAERQLAMKDSQEKS